MSLSRKSDERKEKLKARKERREKGESGFQRAGRFLFNKESYKETKAKWKKDREDKKAGKTTTSKKPSTAKSRARAANVALHGEKAISGLEAKNKDFQKMKKGGLSKADFIKKYPNSNLAKKSRR
tara:strand:+ start:31 stop:405 length:375 start_codon:yes stop_codon:yes gene_type:complete